MCGVASVVLEAIQVLVTLAANLAPVRLVLFQFHAFRVWGVRQGINHTISPVFVHMQRLILVPMQTVVLETVLVFVRLVAADYWAHKRLVFSTLHNVEMSCRVVNTHFLVLVECHWSAGPGRGRRDKYLVRRYRLDRLHATHNRRLYRGRRRNMRFFIVAEEIVQIWKNETTT